MLVDDEINVLHALRRNLRSVPGEEEMKLEIYTDPQQALTRAQEIAFDIVISDYRMPKMNGVEFLQTFKTIQAETVRLMLSASTEFGTLVNVINQAEVFRFIAKPWQTFELKETIQLAFARRDQLMEDLRLFNALRAQCGEMTPQEFEAKRLEQDEPGITKVKWGADGSVQLD
ncbi:MAG TPA: response regulator [Methylobacter sp.]